MMALPPALRAFLALAYCADGNGWVDASVMSKAVMSAPDHTLPPAIDMSRC
jgi:hypothetical protein